jgi:hypothetical protein
VRDISSKVLEALPQFFESSFYSCFLFGPSTVSAFGTQWTSFLCVDRLPFVQKSLNRGLKPFDLGFVARDFLSGCDI